MCENMVFREEPEELEEAEMEEFDTRIYDSCRGCPYELCQDCNDECSDCEEAA